MDILSAACWYLYCCFALISLPYWIVLDTSLHANPTCTQSQARPENEHLSVRMYPLAQVAILAIVCIEKRQFLHLTGLRPPFCFTTLTQSKYLGSLL